VTRYREDYRCRATETALAVVCVLLIFALFALTVASIVAAYR
jgi:hypothetical protein